MRITKIGHCCLLVEQKNRRILIDPGNWSEGQKDIEAIDLILISHEHADHCDVESIEYIMRKNPHATIVTNQSVAKKLAGYPCTVLDHEKTCTILGIAIEAFGSVHCEIYSTLAPLANIGFLIDGIFFYPGDAFTDVQKPVEILALPVEAPWLKLLESIDYAKRINPKVCFPVHDGRLRQDRIGPSHKIPQLALAAQNIQFIPLNEHGIIDI